MRQLTVGERPLPESTDVFASHIDFAIDVRLLHTSVDAAVEVLKHFEFDALAFRGMSGALIAPAIAMRLNKSLILVRKDEDNTHSNQSVEGDRTARTYIIIDDFQATGDTARKIIKGVRGFAPKAVFMGFLAVRRLSANYAKDGIDQPVKYYLEDVIGSGFNRPHLKEIDGKYRLTSEAYLRAIEDQKPRPKEISPVNYNPKHISLTAQTSTELQRRMKESGTKCSEGISLRRVTK